MIDYEPLLHRAAALIPDDARSDAGLSRADVVEYLRYDEFEVALSILEDFYDGDWQDGEYRELLAEAAGLIRRDRP